MTFTFTVYNRHSSVQVNDLVTVGLPFARGVLPAAELLRISGPDGALVNHQSRVLAHWPAGGARWVLVRFAANVPANASAVYRVEVAETAAAGTMAQEALIQRGAGGSLRIDTGVLRLELGGDPRQWITEVSLPPHGSAKEGSGEWTGWAPQTRGGQLYATVGGEMLTPRFDGPAKVLDHGPVVGELVYNGSFLNAAGADVLRFLLRLVVQRGSTLLRVACTLHNPRHQPREELGHWHLGLPNAALIRTAGLRFGLPKEGIAYAYLAGGTGSGGVPDRGGAITAGSADHLAPLLQSATLHQYSSGGENWHHRNHVDRNFKITTKVRGYRMIVDGEPTYCGDRSAGWGAVGTQRVGVAAGVEQFWQNFPKAIATRVDEDGAVLDCALFPDEGPGNEVELQGGEQKTHRMLWSFHRTDSLIEGSSHGVPVPNVVYPGLKTKFERVLTQPVTLPSAEQTLAAQFFQPTTVYDPKKFKEYEAVVAGNLDDPHFNLFTLREKWDEYGWRSFGDINADCEIHGLIHSHYNNEYDLSRGMLLQALRRSGVDPATCEQWAELGIDAARHQADIDIYHTAEDPHDGGVYNGAKFTHTAHALEVGRATHRQADCFALWGELNWPWGRGGGPESGHFDNEGMMTAYYLTGDPVLRDASLEIAECVVFKVSNNKFPQHAYDRSSGNNLACVLEAWRNTWDDRYLACLVTILDKTRLSAQHGKIPIDSEGLAPIGGWSASIFLKSALRFLYEYRLVAGELHAKGWEIVREYVDSWHKYGWDETLGRFYPVVPHEASREISGAGSDYADAAWFTIDALGFAAMFREDPAVQKRDLARCERAFKSYCAVRAPGNKPTYWNTKVTTFSINNGHSVMFALQSLRSKPQNSNGHRSGKDTPQSGAKIAQKKIGKGKPQVKSGKTSRRK
ncbi:MAG TPA: hypothetical protein VL860_09550 [Planctomycetota bacterium]|nr:hypothetical protein [Planctomycetota bacterium]